MFEGAPNPFGAGENGTDANAEIEALRARCQQLQMERDKAVEAASGQHNSAAIEIARLKSALKAAKVCCCCLSTMPTAWRHFFLSSL